jgi:predicted ester cyclase
MEQNKLQIAEQNKEIVRNYFHTLDTTKQLPEEFFTSDFKFHVAGFPTMDIAGDRMFTDLFFNSLPDLSHPIVELIAVDDLVIYRGCYKGTHTGEPFMSQPATGNIVDATGIGIMKILDGKISDFWVSPDRMTIMQQLGVVPMG